MARPWRIPAAVSNRPDRRRRPRVWVGVQAFSPQPSSVPAFESRAVRRAGDPVAVEACRNADGHVDFGDRGGAEVGGVQDDQIAGAAGAVVGERQEISVVFPAASGGGAGDEDGLSAGMAGGEAVGAASGAVGQVVLVDLGVPGLGVEGESGGVAVAVGQTDAASAMRGYSLGVSSSGVSVTLPVARWSTHWCRAGRPPLRSCGPWRHRPGRGCR